MPSQQLFTDEEVATIESRHDNKLRQSGSTRSRLDGLKKCHDIQGNPTKVVTDSSTKGTGSGSVCISRSDSLVSIKDMDEPDYTETNQAKTDLPATFSIQDELGLGGARITAAEIQGQVWNYAHEQGPRKAGINAVRQFNASLRNGLAQPSFTRGELRLKRVIGETFPDESIKPTGATRSIVEESYCAQKVVEYLRNSAAPLPTFLEDPPLVAERDE
jgi:hypothetical protein